jgi:competence protein ComFC
MFKRPLQQLESWLGAGLSLVYPEVCQLCGLGRAGPVDGFVCGQCQQDVRWIKPPFCRTCGLPFAGEITGAFRCAHCQDLDLQFDWARSSAVARGPVLEAIHRYKYRRQLWFDKFLAALLLAEALPALEALQWDCIVPVPLHPLKEREREFNQAERLGCQLSAATGIPLEKRLLKRVKPTRTQTLLSRSERVENVRQAFALRKSVSLEGRRCLLVDDVFTTGSTTSACARVLRRAGATAVAVWTVARGI